MKLTTSLWFNNNITPLNSRHNTSVYPTGDDGFHDDGGDDLREEAPLLFLNFSCHNYYRLTLTQMYHVSIDQGCNRHPCFDVHYKGDADVEV